MSDVFDKNAPIGARARLFALIKATPHLDWLLLTKRVGNVKKMLPADWGNGYENVWLGISTVNQHEADRDFWKLLALPALVHFVSVGPMLGYVDIVRAHAKAAQEAERRNIQISSKVDWVICEGESGPHARPMHLAWPHALQKDCELLDIPFHFKQWGEWVPRGPESSGYPVVEKVPRIRLTDAGENGSRLDAKGGYEVWMNRAGKRRAGRLLDGKVYDQYPVIPIMPAEKVPA
jgi:protein gp37